MSGIPLLWRGSLYTLCSPCLSRLLLLVLLAGPALAEAQSYNWTNRMLAPGWRYGHAMAYDSARGVSMLFGGSFYSGYQGDTWEWNGTSGTWTQRSSTGPSPRAFHAMAYDSARGVTVLFGGAYGSSYYCQRGTWEWDGAAGIWTQRSSTGPSPRRQHAMDYDRARGVTVLFGGTYYDSTFYTFQYYGDTWEYQVLPSADFNRDGHVDGDDFVLFGACFSGPAVPYDSQNLPADCTLTPDGDGHIAADFDGDGDVDQSDFGVFQRCWSGTAPADPNCAI